MDTRDLIFLVLKTIYSVLVWAGILYSLYVGVRYGFRFPRALHVMGLAVLGLEIGILVWFPVPIAELTLAVGSILAILPFGPYLGWVVAGGPQRLHDRCDWPAQQAAVHDPPRRLAAGQAGAEKRRVRKVFGKMVAPETVESLLGDGVKAQPLKQGHIEFVLAFVRGDGPDQVSERVARVAEMAITHGGMVHDIIGALVVVAFGTSPAAPLRSGSGAALARALIEELPGDVKVVQGAADGDYGLFGRGAGSSFTFLVPQFDQALGRLSRLPFGGVEETVRTVSPL